MILLLARKDIIYPSITRGWNKSGCANKTKKADGKSKEPNGQNILLSYTPTSLIFLCVGARRKKRKNPRSIL
jgi:hypothetical protein